MTIVGLLVAAVVIPAVIAAIAVAMAQDECPCEHCREEDE